MYCPTVDTKCIGARHHGAVLTVDEPAFDYRYINAAVLTAALEAPGGRDTLFGYCSVCHTAMRWDIEQQKLVDWPEANLVPVCAYCGSAIALGAHHLTHVSLDITTSTGGLRLDVVEVPHAPPVLADVDLCGPMCLIHATLDNERLKDVFGR